MTPIPFAGGLVLFDGPSQQLRILNSGAAAIWTLVDAGFSKAEAADAIAAHAGLAPEEAEMHVDVISWLWEAPPVAPPAAPVVAMPPRELSDPGPPKRYRVGDTGFGFSCDDDETWLRIEFALSDCIDPDAEPSFLLHVAAEEQGEMELLKDGTSILVSSDSGEMAGAIFQAILEGVHADIDWLGLMHGAAVARDGGAILIPGASGAGKSTLAAFLAARGYHYLSDDLIALRADGRVMPWPTPFSIKRGSWPVLRPLYPELDDLDEIHLLNRRIKFVPVGRDPWATPPQPVRAIVFPDYGQTKEPVVEPVAPLDALARLAGERLWLGNPMTEDGVRRFLGWFETIPAWRIAYPDLETAERQIGQICEGLKAAA
ncbi:MAG TPA: hypothetical protein VH331_17650 [Allosphingosinicella sp.]|nr:hypothetical protein [Allosphingosinicella sp.]